MAIPNYIRAWLFLIPLIPSVLASIFNLYHFLKSRALRKALNNHVIILLLCCGLAEQFTDFIWYIHFYRTGTVLASTPAFCLTWVLTGPSTYIPSYLLMAWGSMERHILIFYPNWFGTSRKRFLLHYSSNHLQYF